MLLIEELFSRSDGVARSVFIAQSYACLRLISDSVRQNTNLKVSLLPDIQHHKDDESSDSDDDDSDIVDVSGPKEVPVNGNCDNITDMVCSPADNICTEHVHVSGK